MYLPETSPLYHVNFASNYQDQEFTLECEDIPDSPYVTELFFTQMKKLTLALIGESRVEASEQADYVTPNKKS